MKAALCLTLILSSAAPAAAQILPLTTQELQQQNQAAIQSSTQALQQGLTQQQIGQIEQQQRHDELFGGDPNRPGYLPSPYDPLPPGSYVMPPPPAPPTIVPPR